MQWIKQLSNKILHRSQKNNKKTQENTKSDTPSAAKKKTAKEIATEQGEPYVAIITMDINPNNLHEGAFELDWNDKFIANLVRAGYQMQPNEPEDVIVDRWFQNVCRHVVMETWEQEQAMKQSGIYVQSRDIGNGRTEVG
jgi:hypothetical protein